MAQNGSRDGHALEGYEEFIQQAPGPVQCLSPDGTVLRANQVLLDLLGYERNRYIGQPFGDCHLDPGVVKDMLTAFTSREAVTDAPARLRCEDGSIRDVLISSSAYKKDGQFVHTRCFIRDITQERQTERALRKSRDGLEKVVRLCPEPMPVTTLADGRLLEANDAYIRLAGLQRQDVIGKTAVELGQWTRLEDRERYLSQIEGKGKSRDVEVTACFNEELRDFLVSTEVGEVGGERCIVSVAKDVTERKQAEAQLRESEAKFRTLAENSRVGIVVSDGLRIAYTNPMFSESTGYTQTELLSMDYGL